MIFIVKLSLDVFISQTLYPVQSQDLTMCGLTCLIMAAGCYNRSEYFNIIWSSCETLKCPAFILNLFYTRGLGIVVLHVMVPEK